MMNNQYNAANLTTPHGIQMAQHVAAATSPPQQTSAAVLNTFYNAQHQHQHHHHSQHQHHQQHQQLAATLATAGGNLYGDPRQLQMPANALDKTYYTTALGTPQRFYTTTAAAGPGTQVGAASVAASTTHPNTILITNNFTHQQASTAQAQSPPEQQRIAALNHPSNIRIVSSSGNSSQLITPPSSYQQAQHVFNLGNAKTLQHLFPQHLLQQEQASFHQPTEIVTHQFSAQHFSPEAQNVTTTAAAPMQVSQYYVAAPDAAQLATAAASSNKLIGNAVTTSGGSNSSATALNVGVVNGASTANQNASSTVVLDRINICINNLYTDTSSSSASNSLASTPAQQPSPIIPAIQHKAILDTGALSALSPAADVYESGVLVIDEPDSTTTATTPHTPPTTPENTPPSCSSSNNITTTSSNVISSPSTSSTTMGVSSNTSFQHQEIISSNNMTNTKQNFAAVAQTIEKVAVQYCEKLAQSSTPVVLINANTSLPTQTNKQPLPATNTPLTPPTPPSPKTLGNIILPSDIVDLTGSPSINSNTQLAHKESPLPLAMFTNGEDVLIKRPDGRFYLGTVMEKSTVCHQYLVKFDDKTEQWCSSEEMRKLVGGGGGGASSTSSTSESKSQDCQAMCVACKQQKPDAKVEICERCGRGYHRHCTKETLPGSKVWLCKRCDKPMKLNMSLITDDEDSEMDVVGPRQLPYDTNSLTWDSKHRVNEEQMYCYCGKAGKFDHNMLQCCRCLNWYHTQCTSKFKGSMLRGDVFFVFCCAVCNDGEEYLRRLQLNWVDLVHLIIYNLSTMKKHQNHKYHHLLRDIYPFVLEKRKVLPITKESLYMPENEFLAHIHTTLKENSDRFIWGKEIKRDHYFFALRTNGPPVAPKMSLKKSDVLSDSFVVNHLKLKLLAGAPENADVVLWPPLPTGIDTTSKPTTKPKSSADTFSHDIYAFDDTSEDEIPIKLILDKVKNKIRANEETKEQTVKASNKSTLEQMDAEDDNANDSVLQSAKPEKHDNAMSPKSEKKSSPKKDISVSMKSLSSDTTSTDENLPLLPKNATSSSLAGASNKVALGKTSRKRKGFNLTKTYDSRIFDSSSDENSSSSSRGTSLDLIIPPPKNFLGQNNPFLIASPMKKKCDAPTLNVSTSGSKKSVSFGIFDSSGLSFSSKLAALKSAGLFPKLSTSNLAKAAGQPRTVRTIKRRLSAKDITIGPNQEVRRRRTRRLSANIEVISTTTINPIPTNFFPIHAKDLLAAATASTTSAASLFTTPAISNSPGSSPPSAASNKPSSPKSDTCSNAITSASAGAASESKIMAPTNSHGRRLRQRPPKCSPNTSRRSSVSSNQSSTSSSLTAATQLQQQPAQNAHHQSHEELKQTVNKYFGIVNRIESGEQFSIRAKRQLCNGQTQYLIEWGDPTPLQLTPQKQQQTNVESTEKPSEEMLIECAVMEEDMIPNMATG